MGDIIREDGIGKDRKFGEDGVGRWSKGRGNGGLRGEKELVGIWSWGELGDLLFVCVKISDMILFKIKSICVNVNYVILTYAIILKGGE